MQAIKDEDNNTGMVGSFLKDPINTIKNVSAAASPSNIDVLSVKTFSVTALMGNSLREQLLSTVNLLVSLLSVRTICRDFFSLSLSFDRFLLFLELLTSGLTEEMAGSRPFKVSSSMARSSNLNRKMCENL